MWMCGTKIKKEVCCICLEKREITLSCYFCLEGNLCSVCAVKLCEEGSAGRCPICRQVKWKKSIIKNTKIVPINVLADEEMVDLAGAPIDHTPNYITSEAVPTPRTPTCNEWCIFFHDAWKVFLTILGFWAFMYLMGVLTIVVFVSETSFESSTPYIWILALFIGIFEYILMWFCCCKNSRCLIDE